MLFGLLLAQRVPKLELGNQGPAGARDYSPKIRDSQRILLNNAKFAELSGGWARLTDARPVSSGEADGLYRKRSQIEVLVTL